MKRVRVGGVIVSRAILVALGIDWQGRRQVLAVECANRESQSSWREFLLQLKERGLTGGVVRGQRRPPRVESGDPGSAAGGVVAAVLRALSAEHAGSPAAPGRRRLPV